MTMIGGLRITAGRIDAPDAEAHNFASRLADRAVTDGAWRVYVCTNDCGCGCRRYIP